MSQNSLYDCVILGAGFAGLSAALTLSSKKLSPKINCAIVDASENLGGLVASYDFGNYKIEKFYHHLQLADQATVALADQLGLGSQLRWLPASVGYLSGKQLYPLNTPWQIARFPLLNFNEKWRLAKLVRLAKNFSDPNPLDNVKARDWVVENCGVNVYENFFAPLLRGKFGGDVEEISAAWLVGRIRFRSHRSMRGERLGYMEGGFQTLIDALAQRLKRSCDFYLQQPVKKIRRDPDGLFTIATSKEELRAKTVVTTQAPKTLLEIFDWPPAEAAPLKNLRFQKTICATVALQRSLTATYWCNISNPQINFAVLLEHTNLYRHPHYPPALLYLANYCGDATDPLWQCSDEEVSRRYLKSLQDYFGLDRQDVLWIKIARAENSGLIYTRGTLNNMPKINSSTPGLFNIGMLRSFPERSINDSVLQGEQAAQAVLTFLQRSK